MCHHPVVRNAGQHFADHELVISSQPDADTRAVGQAGFHALALNEELELPRSFPQKARERQQALAVEHGVARDGLIHSHVTARRCAGDRLVRERGQGCSCLFVFKLFLIFVWSLLSRRLFVQGLPCFLPSWRQLGQTQNLIP